VTPLAHTLALESLMATEPARHTDGEPADAAGDWSADHLGRTLRSLRKQRGLRLADLATESGLSASFLSQVEQGQSDISVGRLMRLAQALHVRMTDLVELPPPPERPLVRARERVELPSHIEGLTIELLASSVSEGPTYAIATLAAGITAEARRYRVPGQEHFVYLIKGRAVMEFASGTPVTLAAGDSIAYMSEDYRRMTNLHRGPTSLIWVSFAQGQ
jgi:transcriptional regulator with XRE-family HTH domain